MNENTLRRGYRRVWTESFAGACLALLLAGLSACASTTPEPEGIDGSDDVAPRSVAGSSMSVTTRDTYAYMDEACATEYGAFSRNVNGTTGFFGIMLKTYTTDPISRPFSTLRSLGFLLTHTLADFANDTVTDMVRLPQISRKPIPPVADGPGMDLEAWEQELDNITGEKPLTGSIEFLIDGEEYFSSLIESVENANDSIHLRTYIFDNDDFAIEFADRLKRRSADVDVRVSMDGIGTLTGGLVHSGSMPATFEPPPSVAKYLRDGSNVRARTLTNPWFTGDHTKVTIIDRNVAYLGGMNIGREYRFDWHDLMVKLEGDVVEKLARDSDDAWHKSGVFGDFAAAVRYFAPAPPSTSAEGYPVRILHTRAQDSQIYKAQLAAIRRAKKFIFIENPYFSDDNILYELIAARRRGVDVRFVIAERGDAVLMDMSNAQAINSMLENGIRVYMYPGMTHVKAAIVDDWLMVGSANLDKLSLRVNNEVNIATSHPEAVETLKRRLFDADFEKSVELKEELPTSPRYHFAEVVADFFL
jgi:cardiolipin synthase